MDYLQVISVLFFGLMMAGGYPCCCYGSGFVECGCCDTDTAPPVWEVVTTGVANDSCGNCTDFNATVELEYIGSCIWQIEDLPTPDCGGASPYARIQLTIQCSIDPSNPNFQLDYEPTDAQVAQNSVTSLGDGRNCNVTGVVITGFFESGSGICDFSSASATANAVV